MFSKCDKREETGFCEDVSQSVGQGITNTRCTQAQSTRGAARQHSRWMSHLGQPLASELPWLVRCSEESRL